MASHQNALQCRRGWIPEDTSLETEVQTCMNGSDTPRAPTYCHRPKHFLQRRLLPYMTLMTLLDDSGDLDMVSHR